LNEKSEEFVEESDQFIKLDLSIAVLVDVREGGIDELLTERDAQLVLLEELDEEHPEFVSVQVPVLVGIEFQEVSFDLLLEDDGLVLVALQLGYGALELAFLERFWVDHLVVAQDERVELCEVCIRVEEELNVVGHDLPCDRLIIG